MHVAICRPVHQLLVRDRKLAQSYSAAGCRVSFLGNCRGMDPVTCTDVDEHHYLGFSYPYRSWRMPAGTLAYNWALYRKLCDLKPDTILAGDLEGLIGAALYKRRRARQCVLIYDIADNFAARYRIDRFTHAAIQYFDDCLMAQCDEVIVPQQNRISNFRFRRPKKLRIVPNCPFLADAPDNEPIQQSSPVRILISGLLTWTRGVRQIVEAAERSRMAQVVVVPWQGAIDPDVAHYLATSDVVEQHLPMAQADVLRLAQTCHLVAAFYEPSCILHRQAAPNKVFDAMAAARPCLLNSEVAISDAVVNEWQCAVAVPYADVDALAQVLQRLARDVNICNSLGQNGRRLFETHYHWENVTRDLFNWGQQKNTSATERAVAA